MCSCLSCPAHGGLPRGDQPRFLCSRCLPDILTICAGGSGGDHRPRSDGGGGPPAPRPGGGSGNAGLETGAEISSSLDFEDQLPILSRASAQHREAVDLEGVRGAVRRLFSILANNEGERADFYERIEQELTEPLTDEVRRLVRRENAARYWDERGGFNGAIEQERKRIRDRFARWIETDLEDWLGSIYPIMNAEAWVGAPDEASGAVDLLMLADAIGVNAYSWRIAVDESPFRRLDIVSGAKPHLVMLAEMYAESAPAFA